MPGAYALRVIVEFAAAHTLRGYAGQCSRMHGHNWKMEVEVTADALDDIGMGIDFKYIKEAARSAVRELDHRYLNDIPPFNAVNPTAENLAAYFYQRLSQELDDGRVKVAAVTLWETDRASVRFSEIP